MPNTTSPMSPSSNGATPGRDMTSEIYQLISCDDVRFSVHEDILTSQSHPFKQAVAGPWTEAADKTILLADWDAATVARLVEFLYRDDYAYPDPSRIGPDPCSAAESSLPIPAETRTDAQRLALFDPAEFDFEDVLLAHARVCVLANYKAVDRLRMLALRRVALVLACLEPLQACDHTAGNVAAFAGYVYANADPVSEATLRKLASDCIARNIVAFQREPRVVVLMAAGGDLVTDVMSELCRRLVDPGVGSWVPARRVTRYIANLRVVFGGNSSLYPDRVKIWNGVGGNVNDLSGQDNVWLIPEYTEIQGDACTGFIVSAGANVSAVTPLDRIPAPVIRPTKDGSNRAKVKEVALVRGGARGLRFETIKRYDGMSDDVSHNPGSPVYLVWKTVEAPLV